MAKYRILVVDDEEGMLEVCADTLGKLPDVQVVTERESDRAAGLLAEDNFDLLLADIRMPGLSGMELLRLGREHDPNLTVLMLTGFPTVSSAVASMKLGAADYIAKPFLPDDLLATVRRLLDEKSLREENRLLQRQVTRSYCFGDIVGQSPAIQAVFETIRRIAATNADVLVLGETGTGKELVARAIHQQSRAESGRFVPVDCGAIPETLLESEFFGHERGAFTGAVSRSMGLLEFADRGTFFLDEIDELPPRLQAKLLRVIQERRIRRVGGTEELPLDVRIIAATSRDLDREMREHRFRTDLYYRINVARIELPPLRRRTEDIPLLVNHFVERFARETGAEARAVHAETMEMLQCYAWPGNIRELQNVIKRTLAMTGNPTIQPEDLPEEIIAGAVRRPECSTEGFFAAREQQMAAFERSYLEQSLRRCGGDVSQASREAKLPRATFYRLMKKHGLNPSDYRT